MKFRERYWDETIGEYEAKELNHIEMEYEKYRNKIFLVGWIAGVPEDMLEFVQSQLG